MGAVALIDWLGDVFLVMYAVVMFTMMLTLFVGCLFLIALPFLLIFGVL